MGLHDRIDAALRHPDVLGAGAKKRRGLNRRDNAAAIAKEFKRGTLRSGSGAHVTNPAQMRAIIANTNKGRRK
jgi:hypothetical protein